MDPSVLLEQAQPADLEALALDGTPRLCVEAFFSLDSPLADSAQVLAAQWSLRQTMDAFCAYDAGQTGGLNTKGYFGAAFDGRHVYFAPQFNGDERHGNMLRYDTRSPFDDPGSWQAHDASATGGLATRGYYGAVCAAPYVYYVPRTDGDRFHTRLLRYDTRRPFDAGDAWRAHDIGHPISYQSAAFDGRFIYLAPGYHQEEGPSGKVLRCVATDGRW